ncbi:hypothetical protein CC78DRAFT_547208 [Lojkania enalia]|uniref:Uncharacterized protein n=1 Tax=Lojkania enalia TaxID=147567 RepID=A0A9P4K4M2_9PLEO|nr:hypothetical protein CC78DRAFT_547208 [Didymosphaeria enalia]
MGSVASLYYLRRLSNMMVVLSFSPLLTYKKLKSAKEAQQREQQQKVAEREEQRIARAAQKQLQADIKLAKNGKRKSLKPIAQVSEGIDVDAASVDDAVVRQKLMVLIIRIRASGGAVHRLVDYITLPPKRKHGLSIVLLLIDCTSNSCFAMFEKNFELATVVHLRAHRNRPTRRRIPGKDVLDSVELLSTLSLPPYIKSRLFIPQSSSVDVG